MIYCSIGDIWDRITIDFFMIFQNLSCQRDDPHPNTIEEAVRRCH